MSLFPGILRMAVQKRERRMISMQSLVDQSVSISMRRALPGARSLMVAGLMAVALAAAGCGGGGGGSTPTSSGSSDSGGTPVPPPPPPPTGGGSGGGDTPTPPPPPPPTGQDAVPPVVYVADQEVYERYELYLADPTAPSGSIKLNGTLPTGAGVDEFVLSKNNTAVVYTADENTAGRRELYAVTLASPGSPVRINTPLTFNRDVIDFAVSPDGTQVVYRADQDADDVFELYLVNVAQPGISKKLSASLTPNGWVRAGFVFSPDGTRVAYRADQEVLDRLELFLVDVAQPGVSKKLSSPLVAGGNVYTSFAFSPDSTTVGYVADQETDETLELFSAPVATPGTTHKLNGPLTAGGDVCRFEWSPDSKRVAYCADQDTDEKMELYTVPLTSPGLSTKVNPPLVSGGKVTSGYDFGSDSSYIVYAAAQDSATRIDLYRADIATLGSATKLNAELPAGGNVVGFHVSPDGAHVGYTANQDAAEVYEIYQATFATPGTIQKMSAPMKMTGVFTFRYSTDGGQIVYLADQDSDASEIYRVDVANLGVATKLNGALVTGGEVWDYAF